MQSVMELKERVPPAPPRRLELQPEQGNVATADPSLVGRKPGASALSSPPCSTVLSGSPTARSSGSWGQSTFESSAGHELILDLAGLPRTLLHVQTPWRHLNHTSANFPTILWEWYAVEDHCFTLSNWKMLLLSRPLDGCHLQPVSKHC